MAEVKAALAARRETWEPGPRRLCHVATLAGLDYPNMHAALSGRRPMPAGMWAAICRVLPELDCAAKEGHQVGDAVRLRERQENNV